MTTAALGKVQPRKSGPDTTPAISFSDGAAIRHRLGCLRPDRPLPAQFCLRGVNVERIDCLAAKVSTPCTATRVLRALAGRRHVVRRHAQYLGDVRLANLSVRTHYDPDRRPESAPSTERAEINHIDRCEDQDGRPV